MSDIEPLVLTLLAILAMGATTLLMRAGGFWVMAHVPLTARVRRMLEALPGSMVTAIVLPIVVTNGPAAVLAIAAAAAITILRRSALLAIVIGVLVAALARSAGI